MVENLKELWKYRALIWALSVRHLSTRYRGSVLGFLWTLLNPLCLMLIYALVFRYFIRFQQVENYTLFLFCGLLPWIWITSGLSEGVASIASGGNLITKSMFPAQILPTVAVLTSMFNFVLSLPVLLVFILFMGVPLHWTLLALPVLVMMQMVLLYGLVLFLASLNVQFRDTQHLVANLLSFLFFLCPIVYPISVVPEQFRFTMDWNPFALITLFYHNLILDGNLPEPAQVFFVLGFVLLALVAGNMIYNYYKEGFAELL